MIRYRKVADGNNVMETQWSRKTGETMLLHEAVNKTIFEAEEKPHIQ